MKVNFTSSLPVYLRTFGDSVPSTLFVVQVFRSNHRCCLPHSESSKGSSLWLAVQLHPTVSFSRNDHRSSRFAVCVATRIAKHFLRRRRTSAALHAAVRPRARDRRSALQRTPDRE